MADPEFSTQNKATVRRVVCFSLSLYIVKVFHTSCGYTYSLASHAASLHKEKESGRLTILDLCSVCHFFFRHDNEVLVKLELNFRKWQFKGSSQDSHFKIVLDQLPQVEQVYFPRQTVKGVVEVQFTNSIPYRYIHLQFSGKAHIHWTRFYYGIDIQESATRRRSNSDSEVYVDQPFELWSKERSSAQKETMEQRIHKYPFQFTIPPNCPSSYQGSYASIQYKIIGRIGTGLDPMYDRCIETVIQVCQVNDINVQQLLHPVKRIKRYHSCHLCCCLSGNVEFIVDLPRTGFCVSNSIPLSVTVENGSGRTISMKATIIQHVSYFTQARGFTTELKHENKHA